MTLSIRRLLPTLAALVALAGMPRLAPAQPVVVFETNFESGLPPEFSAPGSTIVPVQGYAGLGPTGNQFGGSFLRYALLGIVDTKLTLRNLPQHDAVDIGFLLGVIDSWDGTELFKVSVDGNVLFSHWFQLATGDTSSYIAPPGGLLSRGSSLGFSEGTYFSRDRAYDMSIEPAFIAIAHTADTLEVKWFLGAISGGAAAQWQGGGDESWALDHVKVTAYRQPIGVTPRGAGLALAAPFPNPATRAGLRARFTLTSDAPAALELFDARGRRLAAREVGSLGRGDHAVDLAPCGSAAPGVGFLRLTQGAASRVARVVLLD
jgi:hypothetical protein